MFKDFHDECLNPIPIRKLDNEYENNSHNRKYKWHFTEEES